VVALSPKEFQLLKLLASSPGRVFTTQEILEELWPRSTTSYATGQDVQKYVYLLRKKLEENPAQPTLVLTVRGFGYRLAV
ncbi:helix-turn-helix domain-containing protein, partial [Candidatus Bipolaricaulota bacterium]|nr:helix-turn-helix domain-containing protein [Candidatus Bipolaricaulota bacterium]